MHPDQRAEPISTREPMRLSLVNGTSAGQTPDQPDPPAQALTLGEAIKTYRETYLSSLRNPASTISRLKLLAPFTERALDSLTVIELQRFFNELAKTAPSQAHEGVKAVRHIYKKMGEWQLYHGFSPATFVKIKKPKAREVFVDEADMARLWPVLRQQSPEDRLYFGTLLTLFCRAGELNTAKVTDFAFWIEAATGERRAKWTKARTKNGRAHVVPLPPELTQELWEYCQTRVRKDSPFLFPGRGDQPRTHMAWWYRWNEIRSVAKLDHVHIHDLRRSGATLACAASGDLNSVSRGGLQHADLTTTSIYVKTLGRKVEAMFTAHEQALRAQGATPQSVPNSIPRPFSPPEPERPAMAPTIEEKAQSIAEATPTAPPTHDDQDFIDWPG